LESFRDVIDNYLMKKFCLHCGYPYGKLVGLLFPSLCFEVSLRAGQEWQIMRKRTKYCCLLHTWKWFGRFIRSSWHWNSWNFDGVADFMLKIVCHKWGANYVHTNPECWVGRR